MNNPRGVAVDTNPASPSYGDLYVADGNNNRIDKFGPDGSFLLAWGYGVADGVSEELQVCGPAAEPPSGRCFSTNFNPANGGNGENNLAPESVAVDPVSHDVYVVEVEHELTRASIARFTPSGKLVSRLGPDVAYSGPGEHRRR